MKVTFFSSNPEKGVEASRVLSRCGIGCDFKLWASIEIQSDRLEEIVERKARCLPRHRGIAIVDDTGLFVRALRGFPGPYTSFCLRTIGPEGLIRLLRGRDRRAVFRSVVGVVQGTHVRTLARTMSGSIAAHAAGEGGFGFDSIFVPRSYPETFAEMSQDLRDRVSHRAKALRGIAKLLERDELGS